MLDTVKEIYRTGEEVSGEGSIGGVGWPAHDKRFPRPQVQSLAGKGLLWVERESGHELTLVLTEAGRKA